MPRNPGHIPAYRLHKPSGQARVIINREHIYLGRFGSPESKEKYARLIAQLGSNHNGNGHDDEDELSVSELILRYWDFAEDYYVKDGEPAPELSCMRDAVRPLRELYGRTNASEFGPKALKNVRQHMIDRGLSRGLINRRITRIRRVFKWAVAEELIPPSVFHGLQAVSGLRYGRSQARETEPVKPAPDGHVDAVLPYVAPQIAAMIRAQRLTGMRPCEVVIMRACDIDMAGEIWFYEPHKHKNQWRGQRKIIPVGPKAQQVLQPFLDRDPDAYFFSPKEAEAWRLARRPVHYKANRKTPIYPSELRARAKAKRARRNRKPKRPKRDHYDTTSYRHAINYGFVKARKAGVDIPHWHPNQLRHSRATEIRRDYGIEAAQVVLGHARADVTQIYAEKNMQLAVKIARETG